MDAAIADWLNLILRWAHVITGIAWIGSSFFFNWLDSHLEEPKDRNDKIEGDLWMVHGGGFYNMVRYKLAPDQLPETLHWVKWEAGFTWITGFFLLILIYYAGASVYLMPSEPSGLCIAGTIAVGFAVLIVGWLIYDVFWNTDFAEQSPWTGVAISFVLMVAVAWALSKVMSDRASFMHIGAMLGTIMVANVWMRIIPGQRKVVNAMVEGREPDAKPAIRARTRSLHNNYMTLPVVLIMISGHYPGTFGHRWNWVILAILFLAGAAIRHFFNLRNKGRMKEGYKYAVAGGAGMVLLLGIWIGGAPDPELAADGDPITFADTRAVIEQRCTVCHSGTPTMDGFAEAPNGVMFDTVDQIRFRAHDIYTQSVESDVMPPGNMTGMTTDERAILGRWYLNGAPGE